MKDIFIQTTPACGFGVGVGQVIKGVEQDSPGAESWVMSQRAYPHS